MKTYFLKSVLAVFAITVLAVGCKKESTTNTPPTPTNPYAGLHEIAEMPAMGAGVTATLYMGEEPFVGYNRVYVVLKDSVTGELLMNAKITFQPMMDMGAMMHSAPWEEAKWTESSKAFLGSSTFIMPSMAGVWTLKVMVQNHSSGAQGAATFPITVMEKQEAMLYSFVSATDSARVFVALVQPLNPTVGLNNFELAVYKRKTMMEFPPMDNLMIEIDPEMPTMGHGSPNNVDPVFTEMGHYLGKVNFTMTGYWKVNVMVKDDQNAMMNDNGYFDITFQ